MTTYRTGDWVTVTGRITEIHPNNVDLGVEVFSKTDQYTAFVRRDLCAPTGKPIPAEPGKGSVVLIRETSYQRSFLDEGLWYEPGCEDPSTWLELNVLGDVEVIHHG